MDSSNEKVVDFGVVVATKDKNKFLELNEKFKNVLEAYDERGRKSIILRIQFIIWKSNFRKGKGVGSLVS